MMRYTHLLTAVHIHVYPVLVQSTGCRIIWKKSINNTRGSGPQSEAQ